MVNGFICHLNPGRTGLRACDFWLAVIGWRSCNRRVVLADRVRYGDVHRKLSSGAGISISYGGGDVLCHKTRCASRPSSGLFVDSGMV
jgi:hypothetical protein